MTGGRSLYAYSANTTDKRKKCELNISYTVTVGYPSFLNIETIVVTFKVHIV